MKYFLGVFIKNLYAKKRPKKIVLVPFWCFSKKSNFFKDFFEFLQIFCQGSSRLKFFVYVFTRNMSQTTNLLQKTEKIKIARIELILPYRYHGTFFVLIPDNNSGDYFFTLIPVISVNMPYKVTRGNSGKLIFKVDYKINKA